MCVYDLVIYVNNCRFRFNINIFIAIIQRLWSEFENLKEIVLELSFLSTDSSLRPLSPDLVRSSGCRPSSSSGKAVGSPGGYTRPRNEKDMLKTALESLSEIFDGTVTFQMLTF